MKNLKLLTLLWIILITWALAGYFRISNSNTEDQNNGIENTAKGNDPLSIYYNSLMDIAAKCIDTEQGVSDTYNNPSSSIIDVKLAINKTLNQCLNASEEIQAQWDREWDFSLSDWILNVLDKTVNYYSKFSEYISYEENTKPTEEDEYIAGLDNLNEDTEEPAVDNSADILNNISNELDILKEDLNTATNELATIQEEFANVHWLTLK